MNLLSIPRLSYQARSVASQILHHHHCGKLPIQTPSHPAHRVCRCCNLQTQRTALGIHWGNDLRFARLVKMPDPEWPSHVHVLESSKSELRRTHEVVEVIQIFRYPKVLAPLHATNIKPELIRCLQTMIRPASCKRLSVLLT